MAFEAVHKLMRHYAIWTEEVGAIEATRHCVGLSRGFTAGAANTTSATKSAARAGPLTRLWCVKAKVTTVDVADRRVACRRRAAAHCYRGQRDRGSEGIRARFQRGCRRGHLQSTGIPASKENSTKLLLFLFFSIQQARFLFANFPIK